MNAQVINGDLNHNDNLDVEDVTLLIDGYLTGASEVIETNSDYYKVDNSLIVGTWYISKNVSFVFEADGTYGQFFYSSSLRRAKFWCSTTMAMSRLITGSSIWRTM